MLKKQVGREMNCRLLIFLLGLLLLWPAAGDECVPYDRSQVPEVCAAWMPSSHVRLPNVTMLQAVIEGTTQSICVIASLVEAQQPSCAAFLEPYACMVGQLWRSMPNCVEDPRGLPVAPPLTLPFCRSFCQALIRECAPLMQALDRYGYLLMCNSSDDGPLLVTPADGSPSFQVPCVNASGVPYQVETNITSCPDGLVWVPESGGSCAIML